MAATLETIGLEVGRRDRGPLRHGRALTAVRLGNWTELGAEWCAYQEAFCWEAERGAPESYLHDDLFSRLLSPLPRWGHAFAMALEALLASGEPAAMPRAAASRLNARQLGRAFLDWLHLARTAGGSAFVAAAESLTGRDPPVPELVCLTSPTSLRRGHTLLAQAGEPLPDGTLAIRVYDPNVPESQAPRGADAPGWLYLHRPSSTWRYRMADGSRWNGGEAGQGELLWVPGAVVRREAAPFVAPATSSQGPRALIFVEGDARTTGLTDGAGRSLFAGDAPAGFDPDDPGWLAPPDRRPAVSWWTAFGGLRPPVTGGEVYLAAVPAGARLRHRLREIREGPYTYHVLQREGTLTLRGMLGHVDVAMDATEGLPRLRVEAERRQAIDVTVSVLLSDPPAVRTFHIANLALRPGGAVSVGVDPAGRRLIVQNTGPATATDVSLEVRRRGEVIRRAFAHQALAGGERVTFAPSDWDRLDEAAVARLASLTRDDELPSGDEQEQLGA